jgi:hypothetical protein
MRLLRGFGLVETSYLLLELREEVLAGWHEVCHGACFMLVRQSPVVVPCRPTSFAPCAGAPVRDRVAGDLVVYRGLI